MAEDRPILNLWYQVLAGAAVVAVTLAAWHFRTAHLDAETALWGMSPEEFTIMRLHPELFPLNFPSGSPTLGNASIFHIYPLMYRLGLPINAVWSGVIFCEMLAFVAAAAYAARVLIPTAPWLLAATAGILIAFGPFWRPDLANYHYPFYGWTYCWSQAGFLFAISETARGRLSRAALWVVFTFTAHAVIGLLTGIFVIAMVAATWRSISVRSLVIPTLIGAVGCGIWSIYIAGQTNISDGAVDAGLFAALNRAQNFHWYPLFQGTFWEEHIRNFLPLLSMLVLLLISFGGSPKDWSPIDRQIVAGMLVMAAMTVLGVLISLTAAPPILIKLAFHRADTNLLLVGSFVILRRLHRDMTEGGPVERGLAAMLLLAPFQTLFGMPPAPVLLRTGWALFDGWRRNSMSLTTMLGGSLAAAVIVLLGVYRWAGLVPKFTNIDYLGINATVAGAGFAMAIIPICFRAAYFVELATLAAVTVLLLQASPGLDPLKDPALREDAYAVLDAQMWARANTPQGALFMVDPALGYLWRSKSYRPSFGTSREWLFTSVLYNSDRAVLEEGMNRYRALGLEAPPPFIFDRSERRMYPLYLRITNEAQQHYYSMSEAQFRRLADRYSIRYFVFLKERFVNSIPLEVVFENARYIIAKAPRASSVNREPIAGRP